MFDDCNDCSCEDVDEGSNDDNEIEVEGDSDEWVGIIDGADNDI